MSHQMKVAIQIKSLKSLKAALTELGYSYEENRMLVNYQNKGLCVADVLVSIGGKSNRIGFKFNETIKEYELVGDFYQVDGNETEFKNSVKQLYVKTEITAGLKAKRYSILRAKKNAEGQIVMRARSMKAA